MDIRPGNELQVRRTNIHISIIKPIDDAVNINE
jgi:hypothetical protein